VKELERQLEISIDVIRYQTIKLTELQQLSDFDLENERKRVEALTPEREEDEEEQYLRRQDEYRASRGNRHDDDDDGEDDQP
jgi:hypothetical protein